MAFTHSTANGTQRPNEELVASEAHEADEKNAYAFTFMTLQRRNS